MLFASATFQSQDWQLLTLLTFHFQYQKGGFYFLIHY